MTISGLFLIDNTVLTNFALVKRPNLVLDLWKNRAATTTAVLAEFQAGIKNHGLPANIWDDLTCLSLQPKEQTFSEQLAPKLGLGERSCIAAAAHRYGIFVSDDADARQVAQQHGLVVSGTIGILVLNVRDRRLTVTEANSLLTNMIANGYYLPVSNLDDLL